MHHVHHDLIVAWAKGAKIEFWNVLKERWENTSTPQWTESSLYRIKPEPKPDVVLYAMVCLAKGFDGVAHIQDVNATRKKIDTDTCMFIFDGETGKLKDAQVLASSAE
jgi:hypothetical protein